MGGDNEFLADLEGRIFGEGVGLADGLYGDFGFIGLAISLGDGAEGIALGHDMFVAIAFSRFGDGESFFHRLFFSRSFRSATNFETSSSRAARSWEALAAVLASDSLRD